jgi:SAM-dependent methyltransferase
MAAYPVSDEENRIKSVYANRDKKGKKLLYQWHRQEILFTQYRLKAIFALACKTAGIKSLSQLEIIDVGCGNGGWLRTLMAWGAVPQKLHGIDLLSDRIDAAKNSSPMIDFKISSGYSIPFFDASMDLVSANTVFSSILDPAARTVLAQEMTRVLQPGGHIMVYDYRISDPRNTDTTGIRKAEIIRLFPEFDLNIRTLTLAPPIARRFTPLSPLMAHMLEVFFPFLRTHAIFFLRKHDE